MNAFESSLTPSPIAPKSFKSIIYFLRILFCAVNKYEIRNFKKIVNEIDPKAFVTISEDQEIDGGFEKRL